MCVGICPEGTLTRDPQLWPMKAKTGVGRLALRTKAPVIPVAQWGAQSVLGRYRKLPNLFHRATITVVAGPAVDLSDLYDRADDYHAQREATDRIMLAITAQLEDIRGQHAPDHIFDMKTEPVPSKKELAEADRKALQHARRYVRELPARLAGDWSDR